MKSANKHTGIAIALAWPQTYCKQPGSWYDPIALVLGFNQNNYYRVGHAALVLINNKESKAHYFDFGRYHAPYKHARVRSAETDHDLAIKTIPALSEDGLRIVNYREILIELQKNAACHGEGEIHAAYCPVDFEAAFSRAKQMQEESPIPYGPFIIEGSNCSRFVNTVIRSGKPRVKYWFNLKFWVPLSPTPISNVSALDHKLVIPVLRKEERFYPLRKPDKRLLLSALPSPEKHPDIPDNAQWLSGEGAGSWFAFEPEGAKLKVTRYSPQGVIECRGMYEHEKDVDVLRGKLSLSVTYPSNCRTVFLKVDGFVIPFRRV